MKTKTLISILAVTALCSACSGDSESEARTYTLPNPLCGIQLDDRLYEAIFPPGSELRMEYVWEEYESGHLSATGECIVSVDGETAIFIDAKPSAPEIMAPDVNSYLTSQASYFDFKNYEDYEISNAELISETANEVWVWPSFAVNHVRCTTSANDFTGINVAIYLEWLDDDEDYSVQLAEIIEPFAEAFVSRVGSSTCAMADGVASQP